MKNKRLTQKKLQNLLHYKIHKFNSIDINYVTSNDNFCFDFSSNGNGFARSRRSLAEPPGGPPAIMGSGGGGINTGSTSTLTSNGHLHNYSNSYTINGNHHNNSISVNGSNNNGGGNDGNNNDPEQQQNIYEDIDQYQQREPPPMIAPISGVPNLKVGIINHVIFVNVLCLFRIQARMKTF